MQPFIIEQTTSKPFNCVVNEANAKWERLFNNNYDISRLLDNTTKTYGRRKIDYTHTNGIFNTKGRKPTIL